jgi:hypothetical protein
MRLSAYTLPLICIGLILSVSSCSKPRNFDDDIRAIDSLHIVMDSAVIVLDSGSLQITDSITRQLKYIQNNFKGIISQPMAQTLLRFGDFRSKAATLEQWKDSLHYRKDQLENELYAFRNTLADRATHDRLNREISEQYADSIVLSLTNKQQQWHSKINEWIQRQHAVYNEWILINDSILAWKESIPQCKQP